LILSLFHYSYRHHRYCKRVYSPGTETKNVFLTLLRIYLRPSSKTSSNLLSPALDLISRHSRRLDSVEVLQLLPPLVTSQDVRTFLLEALRAPIFDTRLIREINKARNDHLSHELMVLQSKKVKVTDSWMYVLIFSGVIFLIFISTLIIVAPIVISVSGTASSLSTRLGKLFATSVMHDT
jgi:hypothetical protein